jgi:hypothetical protein
MLFQDTYIEEIQPRFDILKTRHFDWSWNYVRLEDAYSYYDIIFSRLTTIDRRVALPSLIRPDGKEVIWSMENILFASAYMRLIFGLEVEYLYFSDFRINIEKKLYTIQIHNRVLLGLRH